MKFLLISMTLVIQALAVDRPEAKFWNRVMQLPENVIIEYTYEPISDFPAEVPAQFKRQKDYHIPIYCRLTKQGESFRIEKRQKKNQLEPDAVVCYDGKRYSSFHPGENMLSLSTKEKPMGSDLQSCFYLSPITFFFTLGDTEPEENRMRNALEKNRNMGSLVGEGSDGILYRVSWTSDPSDKNRKIFADEMVVKLYTSKDNLEGDLFDSVNSRKITVTSVTIPDQKLAQELFSLPIKPAETLLDYDVDPDLIRDLE